MICRLWPSSFYDLFSQEEDFVPDRDKQVRGLKDPGAARARGRIFVLLSTSTKIIED